MYNPCCAHLSSIGNIGIIAPVGLTVKPRESKYVKPFINVDGLPSDAWRSRIVPPRNLVSSIGNIGIVTSMPVIDPDSGKVITSAEKEDDGGGFWDGVVEQLPGWFDSLKEAIFPGEDVATTVPEASTTPEVVAPTPEPSFFEKHGKLILFGALSVGAFMMLKKK